MLAADTLAVLPEGARASYVLRLRELPPALQEFRANLLFDVNDHGRPVVLAGDLLIPITLRRDRTAPAPVRIAAPRSVNSLAIARDGNLLIVADRSLAAFDGERFRTIAQLPARGMHVTAAGAGDVYLFGGETAQQQRNLYVFRQDRKLILLTRSADPITAVAGSGSTTFFATGKWIFLSRTGEGTKPVFRADDDVIALAAAPPSGLFFATAKGVFYEYENGRAYRVFRGHAAPVVRAGKLFVYFPDEGDLIAVTPLKAFQETATKLLARESHVPTATTDLPDAVREAFQRGHAAAAKKDWAKAVTWFSFAQKAAPTSSPLLYDLALAHARSSHELAALAWYHAYLASRHDAPDAARVRDTMSRLRAQVAERVVQVTEAGERTHEQLKSLGIRPGTIREYQELMIRMALARRNVAGAEAAIASVADVTDRDDIWLNVTNRLAEWSGDRDVARTAAMKIADSAKRSEALMQLSLASAEPSVNPDVSKELREWIALAQFLEAQPSTSHLADQLQKASNLAVEKISIGLLSVATDYTVNYLRLRALEEHYEPGVTAESLPVVSRSAPDLAPRVPPRDATVLAGVPASVNLLWTPATWKPHPGEPVSLDAQSNDVFTLMGDPVVKTVTVNAISHALTERGFVVREGAAITLQILGVRQQGMTTLVMSLTRVGEGKPWLASGTYSNGALNAAGAMNLLSAELLRCFPDLDCFPTGQGPIRSLYKRLDR
jgi:hypothetical protein